MIMERKKITITEVGPRDGLQNEKTPVSTEDKLKYIQLLEEAGLKSLETTSFVKPEAVPAMKDSYELSKALRRSPGLEYTALVPNLRGYEKALETGYRQIAVFTSPSEAFNKKNINKTVEESFLAIREIFEKAKQDGLKVRAYVSTVVHCPYSGYIQPEAVLQISEKLLELGAYEISLGETIGKAVPSETERLLEKLLKTLPSEKLAGHFHDTYGMAIANVQKSIEMGLRSFDSSSGGLGGCPYAPGASGNLATEDLVYFLSASGLESGVDLYKLSLATEFIFKVLQKQSTSKTYQALRCSSAG